MLLILFIIGILIGIFVGIIIAVFANTFPFIRMVTNDQGHALFGIVNLAVQDAVIRIIHRYTELKPFMEIDSGRTHQIVLSDATTVIATIDDPRLPQAGRMFIVNDIKKRYNAVNELMSELLRLGYEDTTIVEPDLSLPEGTMLLVVSPTALTGGGIGFRPDGNTMRKIAPEEAKFL